MSLISRGDVVIIQRLSYMKTHKIGNAGQDGKKAAPKVKLGKETVDLSGALGCTYGSAFRMVREGGRREWLLERVDARVLQAEEENMLGGDGQRQGKEEEEVPSGGGGQDNRDLLDGNSSQKLSKDKIEAMKDEGLIGARMVTSLVDNSETFQKKTRFSQAKFLRKKTDKYFGFLVVRRPTMRLLADVQYRSDPIKIMNLRADSLAQLLNQANVRSGGRYLVYEAGCQGLVVAAALERAGRGGRVVHLFQTGSPQTQHLSAMNFDPEVMASLSTLNMCHLRSLEQGHDITQMHQKTWEMEEKGSEGRLVGEGESAGSDGGDSAAASQAVGQGGGGAEKQPVDGEGNDPSSSLSPQASSSAPRPPPKVPYRQRLREQSLLSYQLLRGRRMDGLIVASRQHPTALLEALLPYLAPSRPWAVFSPYKEPLMDAYTRVKEGGRAVAVSLSETWLRQHQVLPGRTHPHVNMSGSGGYILSGIYVDNAEPEGGAEGGGGGGGGGEPAQNHRHEGNRNKRFRRR